MRPSTQGVKCVLKSEEKYLLIKNSYGNGKWTFPGGGVKRTESADKAIQRELKEELGIHVDELKYVGSFDSDLEYKKDTISVYMGKCSHNNVIISSSEILDARWFLISEMPALTPIADRIFTLALRNNF